MEDSKHPLSIKPFGINWPSKEIFNDCPLPRETCPLNKSMLYATICQWAAKKKEDGGRRIINFYAFAIQLHIYYCLL